MRARKSLAARAYRFLGNAVEPLLPLALRTPAHFLSRRLTHRLEAEFDAAMSFSRPGEVAVDVGANIGIFTYGFLSHGANVVAIEPQPEPARLIRAFYDAGFPHRATPHRGRLDLRIEAIGSETGSAVLYVPLKDGKVDDESASLTPGGKDSIHIEVPVNRLDDYGLDNVRVMKVDVEGREVDALAGAEATIRRWRPSILVEIEQRHHAEPVAEVFSAIAAIIGPRYDMVFLRADRRFHPLAEFDVERDQLALADNPLSRSYVRNFFLIPR